MWQICKTYYPSAGSEGYSFIMNSVDIFPVNGLRNRGAFNSMWQMWSWLFLLNDLVPKSWCYFLYWSFQPPHIPHVSHGDAGVCFFFSTYEHQVRICISIVQERPSARSGSRRIVSECPGHRGMIGIWSWWTLRDGISKFKNMMAILTFAQLFFCKRLVPLAYPTGTVCRVLFSVCFYGSWLQYDPEKINTQYITTSAHQNQDLGPWNGLHHHHHHHHRW